MSSLHITRTVLFHSGHISKVMTLLFTSHLYSNFCSRFPGFETEIAPVLKATFLFTLGLKLKELTEKCKCISTHKHIIITPPPMRSIILLSATLLFLPNSMSNVILYFVTRGRTIYPSLSPSPSYSFSPQLYHNLL